MTSIRAEYEEHGADAYYRHSGSRYRNPHELLVRNAILEVHQGWVLPLGAPILDLAAGSGEVTLALRELANPPSD